MLADFDTITNDRYVTFWSDCYNFVIMLPDSFFFFPKIFILTAEKSNLCFRPSSSIFFTCPYRTSTRKYERTSANLESCVCNPVVVDSFAFLFNRRQWVGPHTLWWCRPKPFIRRLVPYALLMGWGGGGINLIYAILDRLFTIQP